MQGIRNHQSFVILLKNHENIPNELIKTKWSILNSKLHLKALNTNANMGNFTFLGFL